MPAAAGSCRVVRLEGFALDVEADAPIVAQELRLRSSELLAAFAAAPGGVGVRELRVHVRRGGPARIIPGTCQPSRGERPRRSAPRIVPSPRPSPLIERPAWPPDSRLKLGVVAEHDRLADSPDTLVVVEPSVGSVARSKGNLYLLVTSRISSRHALEATRLAAETIRNEYYYDESAGIRVCLQKAIATANKRLDPPGRPARASRRPTATARSASASAVVRGNEMYVATVGPAEAYLIRQARLSTLPDPHRERGLPSSGLEPDVWRGEITVGDSLVLDLPEHRGQARPRRAQGRDGHAPPAVGDGAPPPALRGGRRDRQRRGDRLRGDRGRADDPRPDAGPGPAGRAARRCSGPLADPARRQRAGRRGRGVRRGRQRPEGRRRRPSSGSSARLQDVLPRRKPAYRRVTPLASRRETQRRAAIALLALVVVVGGLGHRRSARSAARRQQQAISSVNAGQEALDKAKAEPGAGVGSGHRPVADDRDAGAASC